jgi:hypothetical protein
MNTTVFAAVQCLEYEMAAIYVEKQKDVTGVELGPM